MSTRSAIFTHPGRYLTLLVFPTLLACRDEPTSSPLRSDPSLTSSPTYADPNAAAFWSTRTVDLVVENASSPAVALRNYTLVAVAQHNAAAAAEDGAVHAAISAASVVVLTHLYPNEQVALDSLLQRYLGSGPWVGEPKYDPVAGETIGRAVGAAVVAHAQTDRYFDPWNGTVPVGPGFWFSTTPPSGAALGLAKTYFLASGDQFRSPPPPAFGSPEFLAHLAEVRRISDTRTPVQDSIAKFWEAPAGTPTSTGIWNDEALRLVKKYRLNARRAAHLLALVHAASFDGLVATSDAKFTYWLLRPIMADSSITLAASMPNHPSYPSNLATISWGIAEILATSFPAERTRLEAMATEAALSRVYGGIHFRFDSNEGRELGRRIAAWILGHDPGLRAPIPLD